VPLVGIILITVYYMKNTDSIGTAEWNF